MESEVKETGKNIFRSGKWKLENLEFLMAVLQEIGENITTASAKLGIARQSLNHWFKIDNCMLSNVHKLVEAYGYEVTFTLVKRKPIGLTMTIDRAKGIRRLDFLRDASRRYNISKREMAETLNMSQSTIFHWFDIDDCYIKHIRSIAAAHDLMLLVEIKKKES